VRNEKRKQIKVVCGYGLFKSSSKENVTDAEVPRYRFQPKKTKAFIFEDMPEASDHEKGDKR